MKYSFLICSIDDYGAVCCKKIISIDVVNHNNYAMETIKNTSKKVFEYNIQSVTIKIKKNVNYQLKKFSLYSFLKRFFCF